ncbi:uncharacterized protein LOC105843942 isoform X1 [Hydra vulgaris]|uniref:uncharacterized protein LOC105843942 isoform X1 n=1 Tax=Hydra vulgaris TaxID=6087 RepID=UPI001F5E4696|nr:uncharacterized protein LOC105843942 isoform X2 [Hydra vulgaris]
MKAEYSKLRPDIKMLLDRQHRSWPNRAKKFELNFSTVDIKASYPWLSIARLFLNEMKLRFCKDLDEELHQRLGAIGNKVVNLAKSAYKDENVIAITVEIECEIDDTMKQECPVTVCRMANTLHQKYEQPTNNNHGVPGHEVDD